MVDNEWRDAEEKRIIIMRRGRAGIGQGVALALVMAVVWIGWAYFDEGELGTLRLIFGVPVVVAAFLIGCFDRRRA
ncbi:MAG TPA: hypothetical protein VH482_25205 [Thermomicrobiales bacterium]